MSLYGALFSGVSGLKSQANKLGIISDNVSNVNTVGYKGGSGLFQTLVTSSSVTSAYSPGGVIGGNRLLVSKQGLLQATDSATDIAISGNGFFVVNQDADASGSVFYTRSGSFRADSTGNFRNATGFYLMAWPLDREGLLPGAAGNTTNTTSSANLTSLRVVNVQNLTGTAAATSSVAVGANLNASQSIFPGAAGTIAMDALNTTNYQNAAKDIIVPGGVNSISRGDKMTISTGNGLSFTYRYGGFTYSRDVTDAADSDSGTSLLTGSTTLSANPFSFTDDSNVVTVTHASHGLETGAVITLSGNTSNLAGISSSEFNGSFVVTKVDDDSYTFETASSATVATVDVTADSVSTSSASPSVVTLDVGASGLYSIGQSITVAGATNVNGVTIDGTHTITAAAGTTISFATTGTTVPPTLAADQMVVQSFGGTTATVRVTLPTGHGYTVGRTLTLAGATGFDNVTALELNATHTITAVAAGYVEFDVTVAGTPATGVAGGGTPTYLMNSGGGSSATVELAGDGGSSIVSVTRPFAGNILDATNTETRFLATTGTSAYTTAGLTFKITTAATGTVTFSYTSAAPDVRQKQFNNLSNLASSINEVAGLSARVVNGQLYVGATDANAAVTFANGSVTGTEGPPVQAGIDWVRELGLKNITSGTNRFSSMEGLYSLATTDSGISASIENPLGAATLSVNVDDPLDTINFADSPVASALTALTSATPFTTTEDSSEVTVTHSSPHGIVVGDFVTLDASSLDDEQTLGTDPFTTTSGADPTVTVDITGMGHTYTAGQLITIVGASAVNGVDVNGTWEVVSGGTTSVTFVATGETSTGTAAGGGAAASTAYGSFNGIALAEFTGRFEVIEASATTYKIDLGSGNEATATGNTGNVGLLVTPHNNLGSLVAELGLVDSLNSVAYTTAGPQSTDDFGPAYSPTDTTLNMASGSIAPQFSRPIRIYDAQGGGHDVNIAFLKTDVNTWAIEAYAVPASDVSSSLPDGLIAYGNVEFNGDGTLRNVDTTLSQEVDITWTNGASTSAVTFDWGTSGQPFGTVGATTFGEANGLSQFNAAFGVSFVNQNGAPVGELTGVSITELGIVVASYSNGETQNLYKIPLADFANPDQLSSNSGNVFAQSANSGEFNLREAGTSGVGKLAASSLEASNVELSEQLTDMIIAQRSYQANAKVISTSDNMLEELNRVIQ